LLSQPPSISLLESSQPSAFSSVTPAMSLIA
jgi:hypothetical protein